MYISMFSLVCGSRRFFISQALIEFMYKNFDIDAFDHSVFLFDEDDKNGHDIKVQTYHDLLHKLKFFNVATLVPSYKAYDINRFNDRKKNVRFPILHYISINNLNTTKMITFLQNISSIALANDVWLIVFDVVTYVKDLSHEQLSQDIQDLFPNLELDSQLFIIIPMSSNRDNFELYEAYKVLTKFTL